VGAASGIAPGSDVAIMGTIRRDVRPLWKRADRLATLVGEGAGRVLTAPASLVE
jgi:hypothetical protein